MSLLSYPALDEVYPTIEYDGDEMYDVDFNDAGDMVRSPLRCRRYS